MSFDVTNPDELRHLLNESCLEFSDSISIWTKDAMRKEIQKQVYDAYTPKYYKRTYDFLSAIGVEAQFSDYDISAKVGINPEYVSVGSGEFRVRKVRVTKKGQKRSKGYRTVVYGIHANNELEDERANIANYVFGELGPTRPWGYNKNKRRVAVHSYPGHEERDIITPVMDRLDDVSDTLVGRIFVGYIGRHSIDISVAGSK